MEKKSKPDKNEPRSLLSRLC